MNKLKKYLKEILRRMIFMIKRRPYKQRFYHGLSLSPVIESDEDGREYFYGYFDKSPEQAGKVLYNVMHKDYIDIVMKDLSTDKPLLIGKSLAFNWQMGARAMWLTSDVVAWNDFDGKDYVNRWYSLKEKRIIKTLPLAVMDFCGESLALGINFRRLLSVNKDYAYNCLPALSGDELSDYEHDGIWAYDLAGSKKSLLITLAQVMDTDGASIPSDAVHCLNHVECAPDGKAFIFIHRYLKDGKRFDRLMAYDFNELRCLLDDPMQSHFCWIDSRKVMGYGQHAGRRGWYVVDVRDGHVEHLEVLTAAHPKDGHPTPHNEWVIVDSYPDFSRMQSLMAYNLNTKKIIHLGSVFHDLRHSGETRCDLHPRFTSSGNRLYIDSIADGKRKLYYIDNVLNVLK